MHDPNREKKAKTFPDLDRPNEQNVADEHVFNFLVPFRRAAEEEHGPSRRNDITDADDRLLRDLTGTLAGNGKDGRAEKREAKRNRERGPALQVEMEQDRDANA